MFRSLEYKVKEIIPSMSGFNNSNASHGIWSLEFGILGGSGEWDYVTDVPHARGKEYQTFKAQAKTTVGGSSVFS